METRFWGHAARVAWKTHMRAIRLTAIVLGGLLAACSVFGQEKQLRQERRPAAEAEAPASSPTQPNYSYFSILDGLPILFELHHDTEVGSGKPIDVYVFVIELQIFNSDGNLEPVGLQIHNFFTAKPVDAKNDVNPHNARDCKFWNQIVSKELQHRRPHAKTWPYVEFVTAQGARTIQTNEDGQVWWSDDVECWGARDRFSPF